MDSYEIWVDLAPGVKDLEFVDAIDGWLGCLQRQGKLAAYRVRRRKFGFAPEPLGEFNISIDFDNLTQMDEAFMVAASRAPETEALHAEVFRRVCNFRSALYRDFPDSVRIRDGI